MAEHNVTMEATLLALLSEKNYFSLRDILSTMNPSDIAAIFDGLAEDRLPLLFRLLPKDLAADTFVEMEPEILECHYITGEYDYMLKVTTTNTHTLEMIMNRIKGFHGIKRTQTNVILSTTKQLHSVSPVL